jgi:hypothetical protein
MPAPRRRSSIALRRGIGAALVAATVSMVLAASTAWAAIGSSPDPLIPGVDGRVWAMVRIGDTVYVGGQFDNVLLPGGGSAVRHDLAAFGIDGTLKPWAPAVEGAPGEPGRVFALATNGTTIYVGGDYASINGAPRDDLAAVGLTGSVTSWHADASNQVRALMISGSTLYAGGQFGFIEGTHRTRLAAIDLSVSLPGGAPALLSWAPKANRSVRSISQLQSGDIVVAGQFTEMKEQGSSSWDSSKLYIQSLTPATSSNPGRFQPWAEHPQDFIWDTIVIPDGRVAVGRGGVNGGSIGLYTPNGTLTWHHGGNGDVQAVGYANGQVIAGGHFSSIGGGGPNEPPEGTHIPRLVAYNPMGGALDTTWQPWPDSAKGVWSLLGTADKLFVGGDFTTMDHGDTPCNHFGQFSVS